MHRKHNYTQLRSRTCTKHTHTHLVYVVTSCCHHTRRPRGRQHCEQCIKGPRGHVAPPCLRQQPTRPLHIIERCVKPKSRKSRWCACEFVLECVCSSVWVCLYVCMCVCVSVLRCVTLVSEVQRHPTPLFLHVGAFYVCGGWKRMWLCV